MTDRPIVVAANRLPVMRSDSGWAPSPGGLVRALVPLLRSTGGTWVGWTGAADDDTEPFGFDGVNLHPVRLSQEEIDDYYEGFSNDSIWPLYHDAIRRSTFDAQQWEAYVEVNERFADTLVDVAPDESIIWIHDYQLQLVPQLVRERRPDVLIGFFLHVPFPPWELFSRLPWRTEIMRGLLGADLIGFQRRMGANNFATIAQELLRPDIKAELDGPIHHIHYEGRRTSFGAFPISIDVDEFRALAAERDVRRRASSLRSRIGDAEIIFLAVDRLDYTKGIGLRMRAFLSLLDDGTLDPHHCVMIQVATPTREAVEHYQNERHEVERLVGEINGRHARIGLPVLHYLYRNLPIKELVALYLAADVMVVTPMRDGMNLVAKEYVATRHDADGVLVLSEFAGAADELTDAVLVNPHDDQALRSAIMSAVEMPPKERQERMSRLRETIRHSDVQGWADRFLAALANTTDT